MKKIIIPLLIIPVFITLISFYKYFYIIGSLFIPGYDNNSVCKSHPLIASKDTYVIPAASHLNKGLLLKVENWGDFSYTYDSMKFDVDTSRCVAISNVRPKASDSGVVVSIGYNFNSGYKPIVKIKMDLYLHASAKSSEPYDAESVMNDLANSFELKTNSDNIYELKMKESNPSDQPSPKGDYVFQQINDIDYFNINDFKLQSKDGLWLLQTDLKK